MELERGNGGQKIERKFDFSGRGGNLKFFVFKTFRFGGKLKFSKFFVLVALSFLVVLIYS